MVYYNKIGMLFRMPLSANKSSSVISMSQQAIKNYYKLREQTNFEELEDFLNGLYYGKNTTNVSEEARRIQAKFTEAQSKIMADILGDAAAGEDVKEKQEKKHTIGNQSSISKSVYTAYYEMLNNILTNWTKEGPEKLEILKNNMEIDRDVLRQKIEAIAEALSGVSALEMRQFRDKDRKKEVKKYSALFQQIRELEDLGIYLTELQYTQAKVGDAQERLISIAKKLGNNFSEEYAEQLLSPLVSYQTLKEKATETSGLERVYDIELTSDIMSQEEYTRKNKDGAVTGYNFDGIKVSISAIKGFQQKMDVQFDIPGYQGDSQGLRVSLKSWDGFSGHDLGKTSLLNALLRTAGIDSTLAFGLQLKYKDETNRDATDLHQWAKTAAVMDIAAGLGQKEGYADTLIIQDRKNQCFKIYNIKTVMEQALAENGSFQLTGYNNNIASHMNFTTHHRLSGQQWRGAIMGALQAQKISITTKVNNV